MSALQTGETPLFFPRESRTYQLDFLSYEIISSNHPDADEESGISQGELWYKRPYGLHRHPSVICPQLSTSTEKCEMCEHRNRLQLERRALRGSHTKKHTKEIQRLKPSSRNLYVVVPMNDPDFEEKPHVWDIARSGFEELLYAYLDEDERYADFPNPEKGYTLNVRLALKHFGPALFAEAEKIDFIKRDTNAILRVQKHQKNVPNLDTIVEVNFRATFQKLSSFKPTNIKVPRAPQKIATPRLFAPQKIQRTPVTNRLEATIIDAVVELNQVLGLHPPINPNTDTQTIKTLLREAASLVESEDLLSANTRKVVAAYKLDADCPEGYRYGIDTDDYPGCDECPVWEGCIDAKDSKENNQVGFVSFSEIAAKETGRRILGGPAKSSGVSSNTVTWAIHTKPNEFAFRIVFGSLVCAHERFTPGDRADVKADLYAGELLIERSVYGRYSLGLLTKRDREQYAKDPKLRKSLTITGKVFPGFPYHQFRTSMPAVVLEHRHEERGLILKLVRHPDAPPHKPGW